MVFYIITYVKVTKNCKTQYDFSFSDPKCRWYSAVAGYIIDAVVVINNF